MGAAMSGEAGAAAGALFAWLGMRAVRQQREIEAPRHTIAESSVGALQDVQVPVGLRLASIGEVVEEAPSSEQVFRGAFYSLRQMKGSSALVAPVQLA